EESAPSMPAPSMGGDLRAQKSGERLNQAPQSDAAPGTGWGDQRWDPVRQTQFLAMANPIDQIVLRYEYESGLRQLGINVRTRRVFERERGEVGFAQPPRWSPRGHEKHGPPSEGRRAVCVHEERCPPSPAAPRSNRPGDGRARGEDRSVA